MTKEQELELNIAAVELLGVEKGWYAIGIFNGRVMYKDGINNNDPIYFDLFNKAKGDCLAVVKKLNLMRIFIIQIDAGRFDWVRYEPEDYTLYGGKSNSETYEEAVGAACLEIKGG